MAGRELNCIIEYNFLKDLGVSIDYPNSLLRLSCGSQACWDFRRIPVPKRKPNWPIFTLSPHSLLRYLKENHWRNCPILEIL
jgi:hypothetical protein